MPCPSPGCSHGRAIRRAAQEDAGELAWARWPQAWGWGLQRVRQRRQPLTPPLHDLPDPVAGSGLPLLGHLPPELHAVVTPLSPPAGQGLGEPGERARRSTPWPARRDAARSQPPVERAACHATLLSARRQRQASLPQGQHLLVARDLLGPPRRLATAPAWVAVTVLVLAIEVVVPLIAGWVAVRRLGVSWRFFWYGAMVFFVSQMVLRLPLVQVGQVLLLDALRSSEVAQWAWLLVLSFSAGLFEGGGRWLGYRYLFRPEQRTWRPAVVYGLGHGGFESMALIAGLGLLSLLGLLALSGTDLAQMPAEQRDAVQAQLAAVAAQPAWYPLLSAWERCSAVAVHVGLSLIVLQAFRRGSSVWLLVAILCHGAVNTVGLGLLRLVGGATPAGLLVVEVAITLMAIAVLWWGLRLRAPEERASLTPDG